VARPAAPRGGRGDRWADALRGASLAVLLVGVMASVVAAQAWQATVNRQREERLDRTAASRTVTISSALANDENALQAARSLWLASDSGEPPRVQRLRPQPRPPGPLRRAPGDRLALAGHRRPAGRVRGRDPGGRRADLHHQAARLLRHPVQLPAAPHEHAAGRRRAGQPGPAGHPRDGPRQPGWPTGGPGTRSSPRSWPGRPAPPGRSAWPARPRPLQGLQRPARPPGGEEFSLLLPECHPDNGMEIAERLPPPSPRAPARSGWSPGTAARAPTS
jgi:hypothetical protein